MAKASVSTCARATATDEHACIDGYSLLHALSQGLPGGTATRTVGGFGRHRYFHDARMVDLSVNLAIRIEFLLSNTQARQLLESVRTAHPGMIYQLASARFGVTSDGACRS
jgi:PII-like signaling protein